MSLGTPCTAARALDDEPLLAAAAWTCISNTFQYPRGSAQAGIGCRAAFATAGLACLSAAVSASPSRAVAAELTPWRALMTPLPSPLVQVRYCLLQLTGATDVPLWWVASRVPGDAEWLLHAVSVMRAVAAARA